MVSRSVIWLSWRAPGLLAYNRAWRPLCKIKRVAKPKNSQSSRTDFQPVRKSPPPCARLTACPLLRLPPPFRETFGPPPGRGLETRAQRGSLARRGSPTVSDPAETPDRRSPFLPQVSRRIHGDLRAPGLLM